MKNATIDQVRKSLPERERRYVAVEDEATVEFRKAEDGTPKIGMFVPFNSRSVEMFGFTESIAPGAFAKTIRDKGSSRADRNTDIVALWNHDPLWVLGRQANKTLRLSESAKGLEGEVDLDPEDTMHRHFGRMVETRRVQGTSFGFTVIRDEWEQDKEADSVHRTLVEVRLFDVSPVTFPAYPKSEAEARAAGLGTAAVTLARAGVDLGDLAGLLTGASGGKVAIPQADELRGWIGRLEGFLPVPALAPEKPEPDYDRFMTLRNRRMGVRP